MYKTRSPNINTIYIRQHALATNCPTLSNNFATTIIVCVDSVVQWTSSIVEASEMFPVGVVCVIRLLNTMWLHFQSFPLLYVGKED